MAWDPKNEEERPWMENAVSIKRFPKQAIPNGTQNQSDNEPSDTMWGIDSNGELYGWQEGQPIEYQQNSPFMKRTPWIGPVPLTGVPEQ
ncbi:hypothetical protein KEM56_005827 [Ascosphaera pollenicola]|nr:hypothetical protein KEM56_005827 [Ascosphaera pollenicola]